MSAFSPPATPQGFKSRFTLEPSPSCHGKAITAPTRWPGCCLNPLALGGGAIRSVLTLDRTRQQRVQQFVGPDCLSLLMNSAREGKSSESVSAAQLHAAALKLGSLSHHSVGSRLAFLYAEGGSSSGVHAVLQLLEEMPGQRLVLWAKLIGLFSRSWRWKDVILVFASMVGDDIKPDKFLLPKILKACSELENLSMGAVIHGYMLKQWKELDLDVFVGNSLIDMYAKCGDLDSSLMVFNTMVERDVVTWTALLVAYTESGLMDDAMGVFNSMQSKGVKPDLISWNALISGFARKGETSTSLSLLEDMQEHGMKPGVNSWNGIVSGFVQMGCFEDALVVFFEMFPHNSPNAVTISSVLPACSGLKLPSLGEGLHAFAIKHEFMKNVYVGGSLINMYVKCGKRECAEKVFSEIENKTEAIWNEMIAAYATEGDLNRALEFLQMMLKVRLNPDIITYNTVLAAYARSGQKEEAFNLFLEMEQIKLMPNVVSLNSLISGFQQYGLCREALELFYVMQYPKQTLAKSLSSFVRFPSEMLNVSIKPNAVTITSVLSACSDLKAQGEGMQIHSYLLRNSFESNVFVSTALIDMYSKCENINYAVRVFHGISERSTVTWNTMMAGFNFNLQPENSLRIFPEMLHQNCQPSSVTILILLFACCSAAALSLGRELHGYIIKSVLDNSYMIEAALVDMYAKCGSIQESRLAFDTAEQKDLALWNAMISSYSLHGMAKDAMNLFDLMEESNIRPDHITFTSVLSACRREGLMEAGWRYFNSMESIYGIKPMLEHFTCMVGIIGGVGLVEEALDFIKMMPIEPDACVWAALLGACRMYSNYDVGQKAARALFEMEPYNVSNYVLLSNIYATAGMWDAAMDIRIAMTARGLKPVTACSWIYSCNKIHSFRAGEIMHPELTKILEEWGRSAMEMKKYGYVPHDCFLDKEFFDAISCFHTEKLAICFGIISLPNYSPIRVSKNLRMCNDCHTTAKFISRIHNREVFVKDGCFYHHFKDGICSCSDKW